MKFFVAFAALIVVASATDEVLEQFKASLAKLRLPQERMTKYTELLSTHGKECVKKVTDKVPKDKVAQTLEQVVQSVDGCVTQVKDYPVEQVEQRKQAFHKCMMESYSETDTTFSDVQKAAVKDFRECVISALQMA